MKDVFRSVFTLAVAVISALWLAHIAAIESGIAP